MAVSLHVHSQFSWHVESFMSSLTAFTLLSSWLHIVILVIPVDLVLTNKHYQDSKYRSYRNLGAHLMGAQGLANQLQHQLCGFGVCGGSFAYCNFTAFPGCNHVEVDL